MAHLQESMLEYKNQLDQGVIQTAYRGLMDYMQRLRAHFASNYPEHFVSGSLYFGYMDMTYFSFISPALKKRGLKPAIVFVHEALCFEIWLAAANKKIQSTYWQLFKDNEWQRYDLVPNPKSHDAILTHVVTAHPDFDDLDALTSQIEQVSINFIQDIEQFLVGY